MDVHFKRYLMIHFLANTQQFTLEKYCNSNDVDVVTYNLRNPETFFFTLFICSLLDCFK